MEGRCERHLFDRAVDLCGRCGGEYCPDCLVYPFGPMNAPFCLPCAVARSGVRSSANAYKPLSTREQRRLKRRRAELRRQQHQVPALTDGPATAALPGEEPADAATVPAAASADPATDWFAGTEPSGV